MSSHIEALGGPVLAWELKRAVRRKLWRWLLVGYSAWLTVQAIALFGTLASSTRAVPDSSSARAIQYYYQTVFTQRMQFLDNYFVSLLQIQLGLIIAIVPALTASCLGQEKERGTLFALFGTELTSRQILVGKLLGRLVLILPLVLSTLPVLVFVATFTGRGLSPLALALVQEAVIAFALGAISLLFGVWVQRAADAVIAAYLFLGLAYLAIRGLAGGTPTPFWVDPFATLNRLLNERDALSFFAHLSIWVLMGLACLRLGWGRLRKVCVEQRDRKPSRRIWAFRPAVGDNPIRWRESYVIGLAPMPILRIVPRWLAVVGVFLFSTTIAGLIANHVAPGFAKALFSLQVRQALDTLRASRSAITESVWLMGLVFIALADTVLLVRCGTSVAEEKRRNTWDDLLLTAQSFREITTGKMWGILHATVPYLIAYALPVFILAALGGPAALFAASLWILAPCTIVYAAALFGIDMLRVPAHMDETREGGAFWFEKANKTRQELSPSEPEA